jgi:polar amino acid transport system ATP-binding protein
MNQIALRAEDSLKELDATDIPFRRTAAANVDPVLVSIRDVHLSFGESEVLKGIDLTVRRGEAVSITGPSGSGKSTLLRCINGLITPQRGELIVDGINVRAQHPDYYFLTRLIRYFHGNNNDD